MTGKQQTVIWLGLFIVALNLLIKWQSIKAVIFKGAAASGTPAANTPSGGTTLPTPQPNPTPTPPTTQVA